MNHHVRYVMPVVPLLHIVGCGLASPAPPWLNYRWLVIDFQLLPQASARIPPGERINHPPQLEPGWYAVSATLLQGRAYQTPDGKQVTAQQNGFRYFSKMTPAARIGYSIDVYRVDD
jgi:hypothetical protein